jgi:glycosyltransferase involved in cell wall biosynthesis
MLRNIEVVVWIPLPPHVSWEGEGISKTVENVLQHIPSHVTCYLVVSNKHAVHLENKFRERPNIKIKTIGISKKQVVIEPNINNASVNLFHLIAAKVSVLSKLTDKIKLAFYNTRYILTLYPYYFLQYVNLFLPGRRILWLPAPTIPGLTLLRGKKIFSFWDPFVFEYKEFSNVSHVLLKKFAGLYSRADIIITQSKANKDFLANVFHISPSKVEVINNGSPSYAQLNDKLITIGRRDKEKLLAKWLDPKYVGECRKDAVSKLMHDLTNKATLWRLLYKLASPKDKILIISTQVRPYKGFDLLFKLLNSLICQESTFRFHVIFTAVIPTRIKDAYPLLYERIHEITRVSTFQHALLYHISDLVLHPSHAEGGLGVYPQFEAGSLGIPTLANVGRHTLEQSPDGANLAFHTIDFTNIDQVVDRIHELVSSNELRILNLDETHQLVIPLQQASKKYSEIFQKLAYAE